MIRGFHPGKNSSVGHDVQSVNIIASHRGGPRCCRSKMDAEVTLYVDESRQTKQSFFVTGNEILATIFPGHTNLFVKLVFHGYFIACTVVFTISNYF